MAALEPPPSGVPSGGASDADPCAAVLFGYSSCGQANGSVVPQDAPVAQVSLGWEHTAVVTAERQLYVWGSNEFGQRGDGGADGDAGNGATAVGAGAARPMSSSRGWRAPHCGTHSGRACVLVGALPACEPAQARQAALARDAGRVRRPTHARAARDIPCIRVGVQRIRPARLRAHVAVHAARAVGDHAAPSARARW